MEKISNLFTNHPVLPESVMWIVFGIAVIVLLLWDLLFFNRKNEVPNFMHTLILCIVYILAACVFGIFVMYEEGVDKGLLFFTGFLVEINRITCYNTSEFMGGMVNYDETAFPFRVIRLFIIPAVRLRIAGAAPRGQSAGR